MSEYKIYLLELDEELELDELELNISISFINIRP
jgi:hypothetical protein